LESHDEAPTHRVNIARALMEVRRGRPDAPAISFEDAAWSYAQLWDQTCALADVLRPKVDPGGRVLCLAPNHPHVMAAYAAVTGLGGVFVPVNPELAMDEIAYIARTAAPLAALASADCLLRMEGALKEAGITCPITPLPDNLAPPVRGSLGLRGPSPQLDDGAVICFTSGSTDRPKAVFASHRNELVSAAQYAAVWAIHPGDRILIALPLSFLYGLTTGSLTTLLSGAHLLLERRFHPRVVLERIERDRATVFMGVPTMYTMMLQVGLEHPDAFDLSSIRLMLTAGAPMSEATVDAFHQRFGVRVMDFYALSEVRPVFASDARRFDRGWPGSCGHKLPGVNVQLRNADGGVASGTDEVGELLVQSETLMKGYYRDPERTAAVMPDGWFHTGDLATVDAEGFYRIVGRKSDVIIRGGVNIAPAEVERAILTHPSVLEAAVVGVPDAVFGEAVACAVRLKPGADLTEADLLGAVRSMLAGYKVPSRVRFEADLPRGATGKVDKRAVRGLWLA
jgi:long-chain acyl-CoA synthetase